MSNVSATIVGQLEKNAETYGLTGYHRRLSTSSVTSPITTDIDLKQQVMNQLGQSQYDSAFLLVKLSCCLFFFVCLILESSTI